MCGNFGSGEEGKKKKKLHKSKARCEEEETLRKWWVRTEVKERSGVHGSGEAKIGVKATVRGSGEFNTFPA